MSIALSEYWTRLVVSGISDADGCKRIATAFAAAHAGVPPSNPEAVAAFMVKQGRLTPFQAHVLLGDAARSLRLGNFIIRSDRTLPPLERWLEASRIEDGRRGFVLQVGRAEADSELMRVLRVHQSIECAMLQPLESVFLSDSILTFSPLPVGRSLCQRLHDGEPLGRSEVFRIGIAIADALDKLHAASLVHGSVRADRIWVGDDNQLTLLWDPVGSIGIPNAANAGWLNQLESQSLYAAPEVSVEGRPASLPADLYALGCLLFRLTSGRMPFFGETPEATHAAHRTETPDELRDAVRQGDLGDPLYRVITFAMAKNPAARFASAAQLGGALRAANSLLNAARPASPATTTPVAKSVAQPQDAGTESVRRRATKHRPVKSSEPASRARVPRSPEPPAKVPKPIPVSVSRNPQAATGSTSSQVAGVIEPPPELAKADVPKTAVRRRRKKKSKAPLVLGALCVTALILMIGFMVGDRSQPEVREQRRRPLSNGIPTVAAPTRPATDQVAETPRPDASRGFQLVPDDRLLYVPPYPADSKPAPLEFLPPGPSIIVSVRLADVASNPTAATLLDGISPGLRELLALAVERAAMSIESISRLTIALHAGSQEWPEVSLVIELQEAIPEDELIATLEVAEARTEDGQSIFVRDQEDSDAFYWKASPSGLVSNLAIGTVPRMSETAAMEGGAIPLSRSSQTLWNGASEESELVALVTPNFLFADGRELLRSGAPEFVRPLQRFLQPDVAAALFSVQFADAERVFIETRLAPSGSVTEASLMNKFSDAAQSWPDWSDQFILQSVQDPSWRLLANRLPSMMRFVVGHTRFGVSDRVVVANAYLPARAFPQVAWATILAMNTPATRPTAAPSVPDNTALSAAEMLDREMSVSFDRESLEFAVDAIVLAFNQALPTGASMPPVRIVGGDLQLLGITRNQQVSDFKKTGIPLRSVLTDLVVAANSEKSSTGPKDPKQTLIWVLVEEPGQPGGYEVLITTRPAAESKSYEIPREFRLEEPVGP